MEGAQPPELRAKWNGWAQSVLGGAPEQVEAATNAALGILAAGGPEDQAVLAAQAAWSHTVPAAGPVEPGHVRGRVTGFEQRRERRDRTEWTIWSFTVEQGAEPPVAVEMQAQKFAGWVREGDEVDLRGKARGKRPVRVREIDNLSSGVRVQVVKPTVRAARATVVGQVLATVVAFAIIGGVVAIVISQL